VEEDLILVERHGAVVLLTLNRPKARNAINFDMAQRLCDAIASSQDVRAIVITGADPAFCAGLDMRDLGVEKLTELPSYAEALARSRVPLIAAVNGAAVTGGLEIALGCDFIIASERAVFADTHVRVGVYPGPVLVDLPRRVGMAWAREMSMIGNFVDAATALRIGLANHVKPHADVVPFALSLAEAVTDADPEMIRAMRADWDSSMGLPLARAHQIHREHSIAGGFTQSRGADIAGRRESVLLRSRLQRSRATLRDL
jgi:enoyl-CoA hydratase